MKKWGRGKIYKRNGVGVKCGVPATGYADPDIRRSSSRGERAKPMAAATLRADDKGYGKV